MLDRGHAAVDDRGVEPEPEPVDRGHDADPDDPQPPRLRRPGDRRLALLHARLAPLFLDASDQVLSEAVLLNIVVQVKPRCG